MFKPINSHLITSYVDLYEFIISISFSFFFFISAPCTYRYNCCFPQVFGKATGEKKQKIFKTWGDILYIFALGLTHSSRSFWFDTLSSSNERNSVF